ncbi:hypothetical protein BV898_15656 [Hypsibius exemplaris]|uniref:G-protein coupled receptors family 1 profile domain-containing protein n=1 Tax=Hypsibius exemplaris TaxID=2072580 RepID=A0A9X6NBN1_HYPEX|nr:hypothetical protein BV898_15656 [Hypsibius exemplaris]
MSTESPATTGCPMDLNSSAKALPNVIFHNGTLRSGPLVPLWSLTPTFLLTICIVRSIANIGVIIQFVRHHRGGSVLFDIYVVNLLGANLGSLLFQYPLAVASGLYPFGWHMGNKACSFYLYSITIFDTGIINSNAVISLNRAWAIVYPMSFRAAHTRRFSLTLMDTLYYRVDVQVMGCTFNHVQLRTFSKVTELILFALPLSVIILSFPIVMVSKMFRSRAVLERSARVKPQNVVSCHDQPVPP